MKRIFSTEWLCTETALQIGIFIILFGVVPLIAGVELYVASKHVQSVATEQAEQSIRTLFKTKDISGLVGASAFLQEHPALLKIQTEMPRPSEVRYYFIVGRTNVPFYADLYFTDKNRKEKRYVKRIVL